MTSVVSGREISRQFVALLKMILTIATLPSDDVYASLCLIEFIGTERFGLASGDPEPPDVHLGKGTARVGQLVKQ
jgi:hypothetical protein